MTWIPNFLLFTDSFLILGILFSLTYEKTNMGKINWATKLDQVPKHYVRIQNNLRSGHWTEIFLNDYRRIRRDPGPRRRWILLARGRRWLASWRRGGRSSPLRKASWRASGATGTLSVGHGKKKQCTWYPLCVTYILGRWIRIRLPLVTYPRIWPYWYWRS